MKYYDIKSFKYKIKKGGSSMTSSYNNSPCGKRPQSQFEAQKQCEEWLKKNKPGWDIVDIEITYKQ